MNKTEFIKELEKRLKYIPKEDREDAVEYYTELLADMEVDDAEDVTVKLGTAKDAAGKIIDECTQKHIDEYTEKKTVKGHATVVWLSILGALSLPVSLPLAIVVIALVFALIITAISLVIAFAATGLGLIVTGLLCFIFMWMAPGTAQKAVVLGSGLLSLALGILVCIGIYYLVRLVIAKVFRRNNKKENEE